MSKAPKKKLSSKASSPSWRTMLRQATALEKLERGLKQDKNTPARVKLRKDIAALREQANLKHRSERKAKATKVTRKRVGKQLAQDPSLNELLFGDNAAPATLGGRDIAARQAAVGEQPWPPNKPDLPGHGEIVGGEMSRLADEIAALARKKGGTDEIQSKLTMATASARYMGERSRDQEAMKTLKEVHEAHTDKVVCGFISELEMTMQAQSGLAPDRPWVVASYTLCRILDALNRAGYTAKGKR